jgi:hypothetical protein
MEFAARMCTEFCILRDKSETSMCCARWNSFYGAAVRIGFEQTAEKWRLFADQSKVNLKLVLLHSLNKKSSVFVVSVIGKKETNYSKSDILNETKQRKTLGVMW